MTQELTTEVRPLAACDFSDMLRMLADTRPPLGRMSSDSAYRALMAESLRDRGLWWLVATHKESIIGFVVAIRYGATFWRRFLMRHPGLLPRLFLNDLTRLLRPLFSSRNHEKVGCRAHLSADIQTTSRRRWSDNDASIAKALQIYIDPRFRGHGAALKLNVALVEVLRRAGIGRLDAHIEAGNTASVRLAQGTGWTVYDDPELCGYLVTTCLTDDQT